MISSLACICGGVGEAFLFMLVVSGFGGVVAWWKRRKKCSTKCDHDHSVK